MSTVTVHHQPPIPVEPRITGITIELNEQEARDLALLIGTVGGPRDGTIRETLNPLWDALCNAGLEPSWPSFTHPRLKGLDCFIGKR